jgi:2-polyprenyl-3-methyl-5-hydroxy-6-metoxy-1,4-benzoquinol methylase
LKVDAALLPATEDIIRTRPSPQCYLCGATGQPMYENLRDRLFGAPGTWNLDLCPTPGCRLVWLDPMPIEADIGKAYRVYYTHSRGADSATTDRFAKLSAALSDAYVRRKYGYASNGGLQKFWWAISLHPGYRAEAEGGIFYLPAPSPDARLLDVGCGDGTALARLASLGWNNVEGVDVDAAALQVARQRGLTVRLGTLASQAYPDDKFDVITMSHVFEHVVDPVALLSECHRILKPTGKLVLLTPNSHALTHSWFRDACLLLDPPRHLYLFNAQNLRTTLLRSGTWTVGSLATTVRGAGFIFPASIEIRRQGKHDAANYRPSVWRTLQAHAFYYAESGLLKLQPSRGEELRLIALKA